MSISAVPSRVTPLRSVPGARVLKGSRSDGLPVGAAWAATAGAALTSSAPGVPARRAQSLPSGPLGSHTASAITPTTIAARAATRIPAPLGSLEAATRTPIAMTTTATQARERTSIHPRRTSLPVPSVCRRAGGQQA